MTELPISALKGIKIYYENDLYEMAMLMLKLNDARSKYEGNGTKSRPTVSGLGKRFAELINICYPDYEPVFSVINKHKLPLSVAIEFDKNTTKLETINKKGNQKKIKYKEIKKLKNKYEEC